ncbi:MAG: hypothetical protein E7497_04240 [Ruminococcus sp.]|nr:hypothetical protein [Ruminococcus sp.]
MSNRLISKFVHENVLVLTSENRNCFEQLADFANRCSTDGADVMSVAEENGQRIIKASDYAGFVQLSDRTQIEILPYNEDGINVARTMLFRRLCSISGIQYTENDVSGEYGFMECFISVFARECMKIIKSGLLCGYSSVEENLTMVQGNILFAENSRRNLVHKERVYVRHDVFTPDRSENRLIKAAAKLMMKLSASPQNTLNLRKILSCLDEVALPVNYKLEFANCINTRNTKKYSTVLGMCRMFLDGGSNIVYTGRNIGYAIFFKADDIDKD